MKGQKMILFSSFVMCMDVVRIKLAILCFIIAIICGLYTWKDISSVFADRHYFQPSPKPVQGNTQTGRHYAFTNSVKVYETRHAQAQKVCHFYNLTARNPYISRFLVYYPPEKVTYCALPKTGSSTWVKRLQTLAGTGAKCKGDSGCEHKQLKDKLGMHVMSNRSTGEKLNLMEESFSFMYVRHPFVRLVSTFQNKVIDVNYRKWKTKLSKEFNVSAKEVEFYHFAQWILDGGGGGDQHICQFWHYCNSCLVKYSVIAKCETAEKDTEYIIAESGLKNLLPTEKKCTHCNKSSGGSTEMLTLKYFSMMSKEMIKMLYEAYKMDFLMFGYSIQPYYDAGYE